MLPKVSTRSARPPIQKSTLLTPVSWFSHAPVLFMNSSRSGIVGG